MAISRVIPPIPEPHIPIINPETGLMSVEWYRWFVSLYAVLNEIRSAIP